MDYMKTRELYQELGQIKKFEETADFNRYKKELKWYEDVILVGSWIYFKIFTKKDCAC
jgi:hypothetical protein